MKTEKNYKKTRAVTPGTVSADVKAKRSKRTEENRADVSRQGMRSVKNIRQTAPKERPIASKGNTGRKKRSDMDLPVRRKSFLESWITTAVLCTVLAVMICIGIHRISLAQRFSRLSQVVCADGFYDGTTVDQVDVSGMSMDEALDYWNTTVEEPYTAISVTLDNGMTLTAADLGYSSDYIDVLYDTWNAEHKGDINERYEAALNHTAADTDHEVNRVLYDDDKVRSVVDSIAETVDIQAQDACLLSFNTDTYEFEYQDEIQGKQLDREQLVTDIETALAAGGGSVTMKIDTVEPQITKENVAQNYGMIAYAITDASSSSENRLSNIKLALASINGTALEPGKTFSFNDIVGERTEEAGYKEAHAYSQGSVIDEIGGGICQVSSTVFNAAVKSGMKIKERHPHTMTVTYVDPGKDAAVNWNDKDLKFTNTSSETVYICCYLSSSKRVRVGIFGRLLENGITIALETEKTRDLDYDTKYQLNFELASGETKVSQKGKKGAEVTTYKITCDASGEEIAREEFFKSVYKPQSEIIEYGQ